MNIIKLSDVVKILESGSRPKGGVTADTGTIPSIGAEHLSDDGKFNFNKNKFISENFFNNLKSGVIHKNDILIVKDGATTGKVSHVNIGFPFDKAAINEHVFRIAINEAKAFSKYIFFFLKSIDGKKQILKDFRGATVGGISRQFIKLIKIPIPENYDDQIRIATILSRVENLIAKRKENICLLDELLKSTFLEMFGDTTVMQKQPKIKLGDFILFLTSGSRGWAQYYAKSGDVFLRINNIRNASLKLDDLVYVNPPDTSEAIRTKVRTNDLLFSITADIGRTAVVPKNLNGAFINQHLALIRLKQEKLNPLFVAWFYSMPFGKSIIMKRNREGVKAGLNFDDIRGFELIIPPLPLQNKFASIVEKAQSIKSKYTQSLTELENLYASLSQRAFKGELDLSGVPVEALAKPELFGQKMGIPEVTETTAKIFSEKELTKLLKEKGKKSFSFGTLMDELVNASFKETPEYEQVKNIIFKMLEGKKPLLSQSFDVEKREIVLSTNR